VKVVIKRVELGFLISKIIFVPEAISLVEVSKFKIVEVDSTEKDEVVAVVVVSFSKGTNL